MRVRWSETSSFVATAIGGMVAGLALWAVLITGASVLLTTEGTRATRVPPSSASLENTAPGLAASSEERATDRSIRVGFAAIGQ
jgi:hypothetical protein